MEQYVAEQPINDIETWQQFEAWQQGQIKDNPMIADNSVTLVISNCVLNLVDDNQKQQLVEEIWRVIEPGGRIAISDIISDCDIPQSMKDDPELPKIEMPDGPSLIDMAKNFSKAVSNHIKNRMEKLNAGYSAKAKENTVAVDKSPKNKIASLYTAHIPRDERKTWNNKSGTGLL